MQNNLLEHLISDVDHHFGLYLKRILTASTEHGVFGMQLLDALHDDLPRTSCSNCGGCCNSISVFSLEYHRIIRDLMARFSPTRIKSLLISALRFDLRTAVIGDENRLRCAFRDETTKVCLIHPVRSFACRLFGLRNVDGSRECEHVVELTAFAGLSESKITALQSRIMETSESFTVFADQAPISFFPMEFWLFRYSLGPRKALEIYRELLVPASTPLTAFWHSSKLD